MLESGQNRAKAKSKQGESAYVKWKESKWKRNQHVENGQKNAKAK
jgi:hypothetical protein